jgi:hypothetical protein
VLSLIYIQPNFDSGITRAQQLATVGTQPPRGSHSGSIEISRGLIFSPKNTGSVYEVKAHCLRQIPGRSKEFSHQGELSSLATVSM